jgi:DNA-binding SARP family transcriptional activator/tetratricopeptide (TPR) repeat protein
MMQLEILLLGFGVVQRETDLSFRTRKVLALLAFLAVEGGMQSRDRLAGLLWVDAAPEAARNSLRNTLSYLREALGGEQHLRVERQAVGLNLESGVMVDVLELENAAKLALEPRDMPLEAQISKLELAANLYKGEFLTGFTLGDDGEFDVWLLERREVYRRHAQTVLERLAQLQSKAGQFSSAIETASKLVALDRLNEAGYRVLIGLQHGNGDRAGALKSFEVLQHTLRQEFNLEPSPETLALIERIRLETPTPTPRAPRVPSLPTMLLEGRMVGRVTEFVQMVEAYHATAVGESRFVTISGEPGIGKTRLASEFLNWVVSQGTTVLRGRAFETGGGLAYQPVTDALRRYLRNEPDLTKLLRPIWLAELSLLLPELLERVPDLPTPNADETVARTRLFEAVARFGSSLAARSPVVLFVDDLQWADQASLELIAYSARRWLEEQNPVLMVFTVRSEALGNTHLQTWLTTLGREWQTVPITLESLSAEDTARLLENIGGASTEFSSWLYQETGGQPLFITETLKSLAERGLIAPQAGAWRIQRETIEGAKTAPGIRSVLQARLTRLSDQAREILEAGAVIGHGFEFNLVREMTELEERTALSALDELLRSRLILEAGSQYMFSHDKVREVAFDEAGEARRRVYHRNAYQSLSSTRASASVLARHAHGAHLWLEAFRASMQAGNDATHVYAWRESAEHYERARAVLLERPDGSDISLQLGQHEIGHMYSKLANRYRSLNEHDRINPFPLEARELARRLQDPRLEAHSLIFESNLISWQNLALALELLEQSRVIFERIGDQDGLFEIELNRLGSIRIEPGHLQKSVVLLENMLPKARGMGKEHTESTMRILADAYQALGQWEQAIVYWLEIDSDNWNQRSDNHAYVRENLGLCQLNIGQLEVALPNLFESYQIKQEIDANPIWISMAACYYSYGLLESGAITEALGLSETAFALRHKANARYATEYGLAFGIASIAAERFAEARDTLTFTIGIARGQSAAELQVWGHMFLEFLESHLCSAFALQNDWANALEHARNAVKSRFATDNERGWHAPRLKHWLEVEALLRGGELDLARQTVQRLEAITQKNERLEVSVLRARAVLEAWDGKTKAALRLLERAKKRAEHFGLPLEVHSLETAILQHSR